MNPIVQLLNFLSSEPSADYPLQSRVHPLRSFPKGVHAYVKREDELGFGISGCKVRKYRYLIPWLKSQKVDEVLLIGSSHSNNLVGLLQCLRENELNPVLFLCAPAPKEVKGNFLWINLFSNPRTIHWIPRGDWSKVDEVASLYKEKKSRQGIRVEIIGEGANHEKSFLGALTLPLDILRNEEHLKITFDHIFIDSATALMASALSCAFAFFNRETWIHVLQLYGDQSVFEQQLSNWSIFFQNKIKIEKTMNFKFNLLFPENARSFGSFNQTSCKQIIQIARQEGFLTDPIYSGKLFVEARREIIKKNLRGNVLMIHSGGGLSLMGFQEMIAKKINSLSNTEVFN